LKDKQTDVTFTSFTFVIVGDVLSM